MDDNMLYSSMNNITTLQQLKQYARNQVQNESVKLHKHSVDDVENFISTFNIYELKYAYDIAFYLPEKQYFYNILTKLKEIVSELHKTIFSYKYM